MAWKRQEQVKGAMWIEGSWYGTVRSYQASHSESELYVHEWVPDLRSLNANRERQSTARNVLASIDGIPIGLYLRLGADPLRLPAFIVGILATGFWCRRNMESRRG